ncbi:hypothetical protein [Gracilimonas sp. BCB1]|uniref:hypothetical protein n=1 Tax=Gracilimonas sp. BCB1 TaxID=3152362 RepID=UPI0032D99D18
MNSSFYRIITTLVLTLTLSATAFAQPSPEGEPQRLISVEGADYMNPVWSPDGTKIAFTSSRQQGLWIADADGSDIEQITNESAGYGFSWSSDSESILTRVSEFQNKRRKLAVKIYHTNGNEPTLLTEFRDQMPSIPKWANYDRQVVLISDNDIESFDSGKEVSTQQKASVTKPFYVLKSNQIATGKVPENSTENISPFEDAQYLNLEVSPDGRKLAFEVYGGNLFVMNIDGTNLMDLGKANRAKWSPDSQYLVAMVAEDDGHNYTKSDLYALSIDGEERINLTSSTDIIAMNPDWSPQGNRIAFDSPDDGNIYILNIAN